jgi:hypothetical protein
MAFRLITSCRVVIELPRAVTLPLGQTLSPDVFDAGVCGAIFWYKAQDKSTGSICRFFKARIRSLCLTQRVGAPNDESKIRENNFDSHTATIGMAWD